MVGGGQRDRLSTREALRLCELVTNGGYTQLEAGAAVGVSQTTVSRLLKRVAAAKDLYEAGDARGAQQLDPTRAFKRRSTGRPRSISGDAEAVIRKVVDTDPYGNAGDWLAAAEALGVTTSRATLNRWLKTANVKVRVSNNARNNATTRTCASRSS